MENFVAVKPWLDFSIEFMKPLRDSKDSKEQASEEIERQLQALVEKFQSTLMQEALLFDKIYFVGPVIDPDSAIDNLITSLLEESGSIFSFVDAEDVLSESDGVAPQSESYMKSFEDLILYGVSAGKRIDKFKKTILEFRRKFPEAQPQADGTWKRRERKTNPDEEEKWHQDLRSMLREIDKSMVENLYPFYDFLTRVQALKMEYFANSVTTPLLSYTSYLPKIRNSMKYDIAQLVVHRLPMTDSNTTWDKIIEYRQNPDNRKDLLGLRRWIRKLSTEDLSPAECIEELEWLQSEFQAHLRLHKIKSNTGTLEVVIKAPLEILENLVNLKFSKLVDPLFAIKKRQIALMEAEMNAPGKEIAYLVKTNQSFES